MTERIKTIILTIVSGLVGAFVAYPIAPALFGIAVLSANHRYIKFRVKIIAYLLVVPMSLAMFLYGGLVLAALARLITGFLSESISIYIGSGLCALVMACIFQIFLKNIRLSISTAILIFTLAAIALLMSFIVVGHRLDNLYKGFRFDDNFPFLVGIWQAMVGFRISFTVKNHREQ